MHSLKNHPTSTDSLTSPASEFSLMPFWFWNDDLNEKTLLQQIADFQDHGVHGFVIHPRVGLPRSIGWMSEAMLRFMSIAIDEAARREMKVLLYDEGMYPSGSSCGQVVAEDPSLACRCLAILPDGQAIPPGANPVALLKRINGQSVSIIDRKVDSVIRGLHYIDEAAVTEDRPPAGDILNPRTAQMVLKLVYEKFYAHFKDHFGKTILGVFTDEPSALGRSREKNVKAGTTGILANVSERLGYDFTPHLPALWFDDEPDAARHRADYAWAIGRRLEQSWYRPLSEWCEAHGVALCGHPDRGDEIGVQRFFHMPGQDLVWRWVAPDSPTALEGPESTQGKCSSSAMIHLARRRNSNEFCGAYGHETTFAEFKWLADWCLVRGVNLLIPHAFYYSVRGPRRDERPPQVGGVGCTWWGEFKPFAEHCRRLCWVNTDSQHVCNIAILTGPEHCPWHAAKVCFEHQRDFNYLEIGSLEAAGVNESGLSIAGMHYAALIIDGELSLDTQAAEKLRPLERAGRIFRHSAAGSSTQLVEFLNRSAPIDIRVSPNASALRVRHVIKSGRHYYFFFNETGQPLTAQIELSIAGEASWIDTATGEASPVSKPIQLHQGGYGASLLCIVERS